VSKQKKWRFDMVRMTDSMRSGIMASTLQDTASVVWADGKDGKSEVIAYMPIQGKWNKRDAENAKRLAVALYMQSQAESVEPGITDQLWKLITAPKGDADE